MIKKQILFFPQNLIYWQYERRREVIMMIFTSKLSKRRLVYNNLHTNLFFVGNYNITLTTRYLSVGIHNKLTIYLCFLYFFCYIWKYLTFFSKNSFVFLSLSTRHTAVHVTIKMKTTKTGEWRHSKIQTMINVR